jgi:transcription initiation factor TFIID subunit 5
MCGILIIGLALRFFSTFSPPLSVKHTDSLHHLSTLLLPTHVQNDSLAQRFRSDKYSLRMSKSGFSLLIGWLTEGLGGEATGAGEGFSGDAGRRGRIAVMQVVNNHLTFDSTSRCMSVMCVELTPPSRNIELFCVQS